jgi:hypothetical protein
MLPTSTQQQLAGPANCKDASKAPSNQTCDYSPQYERRPPTRREQSHRGFGHRTGASPLHSVFLEAFQSRAILAHLPKMTRERVDGKSGQRRRHPPTMG